MSVGDVRLLGYLGVVAQVVRDLCIGLCVGMPGGLLLLALAVREMKKQMNEGTHEKKIN